MQLVQIGTPQPVPQVSVREMFERMAQKEADMIRGARERAFAQVANAAAQPKRKAAKAAATK